VAWVGDASGELEMWLDSGGTGGMYQGFREFHGRSFSGFVGNKGVGLGTVPGVFHSKAICKARETVVVVERSVGADRPWDPVIARRVLPMLTSPSVDTAIITRGRKTALPPRRMVSPASIKRLSVTYGLFPFQLLPPHLLEVEVETLIKG